MTYDPSVSPSDIAPGTPMDTIDHPARSMPQATQHYAGDVVPLHPPGTFSRNTDSGDSLNAVAKGLGMKPPANIIKFPRK